MKEKRQALIEHLALTLIYDQGIRPCMPVREIIADALKSFEVKHDCSIDFETYRGT